MSGEPVQCIFLQLLVRWIYLSDNHQVNLSAHILDLLVLRVEAPLKDIKRFHEDFTAILIRIGNLTCHRHERCLVGNYVLLFGADQSDEITIVIQQGIVQSLYTCKVPAFGSLNVHMIQELVVVSQQSSSLFWLKLKALHQRKYDELEGCLAITEILGHNLFQLVAPDVSK